MDFKAATTEWIELKAQLAAARKDLVTLNQREKDLRKFVTHHMQINEIDVVKVRETVKVSLKTKITKGSLTKEVIKKGLSSYFGGDEVKVEGAFTAISDAAPSKETSAVTVTGLKNLVA